MALECNGKSYELSFGVKRLQMAEGAVGRSVIKVFEDMPTLSDLATVCGFGLKEEGAAAWVNPKQGVDLALGMIGELGFMTVYKEVTEAVERDCGFLFR